MKSFFSISRLCSILFWSFICWLVFRTFLFQAYKIPSASMYGSLFEGDHVVINKAAYGPRLPFTPLAIKVGAFQKYVTWVKWPYIRLFGYNSIQRNDVVAFNFALSEQEPVDLQEEYIKRCVGLPGDSVKINAGALFVNTVPENNEAIYKEYEVVSGSKRVVSFMSTRQADSVSQYTPPGSVTLQVLSKDYCPPTVYPNHSVFKWNNDFFGSLWIPKKGDSVLLTHNNLILYQKLIEVYEKNTLGFKHDSAFINGAFQKYYRFNQNYYFLLGDNRHNSTDSRAWGPIPEDHIIGKASCILYSSSQPGRRFLLVR